jgi:hypothetical protein
VKRHFDYLASILTPSTQQSIAFPYCDTPKVSSTAKQICHYLCDMSIENTSKLVGSSHKYQNNAYSLEQIWPLNSLECSLNKKNFATKSSPFSFSVTF